MTTKTFWGLKIALALFVVVSILLALFFANRFDERDRNNYRLQNQQHIEECRAMNGKPVIRNSQMYGWVIDACQLPQ